MLNNDWLELLPEAALLLDARGQVVGRNATATALFGPDDPSLSGVTGFSDWLERRPFKDDVFRGRLHARRASGVPLSVEMSARPRPEPTGGALCLVVEPNRDKVAAAAERYFDFAFSTAPIGMAIFNTDGEYVRVNGALCRMLGRTEAELLGRRDQEFTHPDDRQSDVDAAWRILRGEISTWSARSGSCGRTAPWSGPSPT